MVSRDLFLLLSRIVVIDMFIVHFVEIEQKFFGFQISNFMYQSNSQVVAVFLIHDKSDFIKIECIEAEK